MNILSPNIPMLNYNYQSSGIFYDHRHLCIVFCYFASKNKHAQIRYRFTHGFQICGG